MIMIGRIKGRGRGVSEGGERKVTKEERMGSERRRLLLFL